MVTEQGCFWWGTSEVEAGVRKQDMPTVMLMSTLLLLWSKCTVTVRMPSSSTPTERGNMKKATSEEASRHSITDSTTYSFLFNTAQSQLLNAIYWTAPGNQWWNSLFSEHSIYKGSNTESFINHQLQIKNSQAETEDKCYLRSLRTKPLITVWN